MISAKDILPSGWRDLLAERGPCAIGHDVATTTKAKSNPSNLTLMQQVGLDYIVRLTLRYKTSDPAVSEALIRELLQLPHGLRVRKVCADSTNERFYVANLKASLAGLVVVQPIINSETMVLRGEKMTWKQYLGNLLVNTCDDGHLLLPNEKWLEQDLRQVKRANGSFEADPDENGNHADAFDGIKLALHGLTRAGGAVEASAARVGTLGAPVKGRWWKNPLAKSGSGERRMT